jgi:hypothetical protein
MTDAKSERLKERYQQEYSEAHKKVKRLGRKDKREHMEELATQAEEAADKGEQGTLYKINKQISGKFKPAGVGPVKDKEGKLLTTEKEIEERWAEHFQEVLNRPAPENTPEIEEAEEDLDINTEPPTKEEIIKAGGDCLNAELFKTDPETSAAILQPLFEEIWRKEEVPSQWTKGIIIKLPKKGAQNDCNNWRGITLLSVPSKILAKIIIQRITDSVDKSLRKEQAGFRKNRGCIDQIFALRNIIEQCTE